MYISSRQSGLHITAVYDLTWLRTASTTQVHCYDHITLCQQHKDILRHTDTGHEAYTSH